jgi:hypothetical protein
MAKLKADGKEHNKAFVNATKELFLRTEQKELLTINVVLT